jgi:cyclase
LNKTRVIPVLLLKGSGLYKTVNFKSPKYIGDPINSVRIFNDKEVDELVFLDIDATQNLADPNYELLNDIASEAFMPMAYGGGLRTIEQVRKIFRLGFEKVILNSVLYYKTSLISEIVKEFGSQSVVGCVDVNRNFFQKFQLYSNSGSVRQKISLTEHLKYMVREGVGEIFVNSISKDGMMNGYDLELIKKISDLVKVPIIACGGAASLIDFELAVKRSGASAVAAGSMFVFMGSHKAVLINYPERSSLIKHLP